jgi:hypothetical protein
VDLFDSLRWPDPARTVIVNIDFGPQTIGLSRSCSLSLNRFGYVIPDSEVLADGYKAHLNEYEERDADRLPNPSELRFEPLPAKIIEQADRRRMRPTSGEQSGLRQGGG